VGVFYLALMSLKSKISAVRAIKPPQKRTKIKTWGIGSNPFRATKNLTIHTNGLFLCKKSRRTAGFFNICDFGMGHNFKPEPQNPKNLYTAHFRKVTLLHIFLF
jgi:hypothetical protein